MPLNKLIIPVALSDSNVELHIYDDNEAESMVEQFDAIENGEAIYQLKEGYFYEYKITEGYCLKPSEIVSQSKVNKSSGRISPNIYVGTLNIEVLDSVNNSKCGEINLEVQSVKTTYRQDYRHMLEEITERCHDLLLQHTSLASQKFEPDYFKNSATAYQRFAFIKSIIDSVEFNDAVHKILASPVTKWKHSEAIKDIRAVKRFNQASLRQLTSASNRIDVPQKHPLKESIDSIPSKIKTSYHRETVDTPENRFIKHALLTFQSFCSDFHTKIPDTSRIKKEASLLIDTLESYLAHSIFKEISTATMLPLNSPVLQRKEGYRDVLRVWLMFDLAAKLVWHGGEDVYSGNKRDVAVLYEYWLFFKLLEIVQEVFDISPKSFEELIKETNDGLGLQLRQGKYLPLKGIYKGETRKLEIEFSYNRTFSGNNEYPKGGSWTRSMKPDYTLSIWPFGIDVETAEKEELIVHVHFDAKYKVEKLSEILGDESLIQEEKEEQRKGTYKRADLLKMHTYKDAIRRTAGAYVLYPGTEEKYTKLGYHELIPGLGAFSIRPSTSNNGTEDLKNFLHEIVEHFMNRASQREKISLKTYETFKDKVSSKYTNALPETIGVNRNLIPDETYVLIAYCKKDSWDWIIKTGLYNTRAENSRGSLRLGPKEAGAKYILLHSKGETISNKLLKIVETGPRVFSKQTLIEKGYPSEPSQNYYLVYKVEEVKEQAFENLKWDISLLKGYKTGMVSALPFAISLTELMEGVIK